MSSRITPEEMAAADEAFATMADTFPPHIYRMFKNYKEAGFTADQAMDLIKVQVNAMYTAMFSSLRPGPNK